MKRRPFERSTVSEAVPPSEPAGTFARIYAAVRQIPAGKAATYGQIARLAGMPRCARMVGYALAACRDETVPCHRVVDRLGRTKPCFDILAPGTQRALLEAEGVTFRCDGTVNLAQSGWDGSSDDACSPMK